MDSEQEEVSMTQNYDEGSVAKRKLGLIRAHRIALVAAVLVIGAIVAACSGGGGSGGATSSDRSSSASTYTIGGTVSGLAAMGLVLQNNGANDLTLGANGTFSFANALTNGSTYAVTVKTQPSSATQTQQCTVTNASGAVTGSNISNITIACITTAINGVSVPPDPGAAGIQTVAGIDADKNAIRDDIDIFIATRYGTNATALQAARMSARASQLILTTSSSDATASRAVVQENADVGVCAGIGFRAAGMDSQKELTELYLRTNNTQARLQQDQAVGAAAGTFTRSATDVVCP